MGSLIDREKVIKALQNCSVQNDVGCQGCPYFEERKTYGHEWCTTSMAQDALALLKEQDAIVKQWTKEIADNQLAHSPKDFNELMSLDEHLDNEYKRGIWDGLQIAWNIISEGR